MAFNNEQRIVKGTKVVLLGNSNVGKSCMAERFVYDEFEVGKPTTIGAAYMSKTITIDEKTTNFMIWDTAGGEKFSTLAPLYYRGAKAAIIAVSYTHLTLPTNREV